MKRYASPLLAGAALATVATELLRYWITDHAIEPWVIAIAVLLGFFAYYLKNPRGAKDAFGFAVDQSVKIIGAVRSGRRSTDPMVAVTAVTAPTPAAAGVRAITGARGDVLYIEPTASTPPSATDSEHDEVIP